MNRRSLLAILTLALTLLPGSALAEQWQQLFNGKDLTGWEHVGPRSFSVEHGLLKSEGGMGLLWYTPEKIGNAAGGADIGL